MEHHILDNHAAFNRWQVMEGMKVNESGTKPSIYITEIKFKKLFKTLSAEELKRIFKREEELSKVAVMRYQKKLIDKMEQLSEQQILTALNIYLREEDAELIAEYIWCCSIDKKRSKEDYRKRM